MVTRFIAIFIVVLSLAFTSYLQAGNLPFLQKKLDTEDVSMRGQLDRLDSDSQTINTTGEFFRVFDLMLRGYGEDGQTYEQIVEDAVANRPKKRNDYGLLLGSDVNVLSALQRRADQAKISPPIKLDRYYDVKLGRGEIVEVRFSAPQSFAIFIPNATGQYVIESYYERGGVPITSTVGLAEPISFFRAPDAGLVLRVKITRAPKFE